MPVAPGAAWGGGQSPGGEAQPQRWQQQCAAMGEERVCAPSCTIAPQQAEPRADMLLSPLLNKSIHCLGTVDWQLHILW